MNSKSKTPTEPVMAGIFKTFSLGSLLLILGLSLGLAAVTQAARPEVWTAPRRQKLTVSLLILITLLCGIVSCSRTAKREPSAAAPSPVVAKSPEIAVTPLPEPAEVAPAVASPLAGGGWQITVTGARQETELSRGGSAFDRTTYQPKEGYTFLVVDLDFRRLASKGELKVSSENAAIIGRDGSGSRSAGSFGSGNDYCVGCRSTITLTVGDELSHSFVFTVKEVAINQPFKFKYPGVPLIPLKVSRTTSAFR